MPPWPSAFPYLYHFSIIVNHHTKNAYLTTRRKHIIHTSESMSHCLITVHKGKFLHTCQTCIWVAHSVKLLRLNVAGSVFESRWSMNGLQQVLWSEAARTFLLFQMSDLPCALYLNQKRVFAPSHLNFCSVLNYYTSELICFFHIHSVSAVLLLPLCATPYGSFTGLAPVIAACSYI